MTHGGTTCVRLKWTKGQSPRDVQAAANLVIGAAAAPEALNGTSGSRVARFTNCEEKSRYSLPD